MRGNLASHAAAVRPFVMQPARYVFDPHHPTLTRTDPMDQRIRLCTAADGVRVAYAKSGSGPPLVKTANWLTHLEHDWTTPVWRHWLTEEGRAPEGAGG